MAKEKTMVSLIALVMCMSLGTGSIVHAQEVDAGVQERPAYEESSDAEGSKALEAEDVLEEDSENDEAKAVPNGSQETAGQNNSVYAKVMCTRSNLNDGYLDSNDAINFIRFIYNDSGKNNSELTDEVIIDSDFYKLLTGRFSDNPIREDNVRTAFLLFIGEQINHHISQSSYNLDYSRSVLKKYMEKQLNGKDELPEQIYKEYTNFFLDELSNGILDVLSSGVGKATGVYVTENEIANLQLVNSVWSDVADLPNKIENFVDSAVAAVNVAFLPLNSELSGRYSYFNCYISCRNLGGPDDIVFQTAMDYNFLAVTENAGLAGGVMNCLPGVDSWKNHRETIDRWAEMVYQLTIKKFTNIDYCTDQGHYYGETSNVKAPSCTETGKNERICMLCGNKIETEIPATGHSEELRNEKTSTCKEKGYSGDIYCSVCTKLLKSGEPTELADHDYEIKVVKEATYTETGIKKYTCKVCGNTKEEIIPIVKREDISSVCNVAVSDEMYTGQLLTPSVTVNNGNKILKKDVDYTVSYEDNIESGTGKVIVTGIGDYTGSLTKNFIIHKANQSMNAEITTSNIKVGKSVRIIATGKGMITYKSENPSIAMVNEQGIVTGIAVGTVKITVTAVGDNNYNPSSNTFEIVILGDDGEKEEIKEDFEETSIVKISKISISGISKKIAAGKKIKLTANVTPSDAANKSVKWKSSNKKVATVNSKGVVTMKKKSGGKKVTITATATDGSNIKATYKIISMKGVVKKVVISGKKTVKAGKPLKLKAKVTASKKANTKLKWTSSNTKYATVSNSGKVKTKKAGRGKKVKITAMATDGSGKKKTVTIKIK